MTSYLLIRQVARRRRPAEAQCTRSLGLGYKMCAVIPAAGKRTHGTTFRALKITSRVATPGAESAVYDCLVYPSNRYVVFTAALFALSLSWKRRMSSIDVSVEQHSAINTRIFHTQLHGTRVFFSLTRRKRHSVDATETVRNAR